MRRLLSLAAMVAVGLAAPIGVAADSKTADSKSAVATSTDSTASTKSTAATTPTKPVLTAEQAANLPTFMRSILETAGIAEKPVHPWFAWWQRTFGVDPKPAPMSSSTTATASR